MSMSNWILVDLVNSARVTSACLSGLTNDVNADKWCQCRLWFLISSWPPCAMFTSVRHSLQNAKVTRNAEHVTHLNSSAYSALNLWSYFILRFFLGGVSQSSRFGSPSAIFFVYVYVTETTVPRHVSFTLCRFAIIVSSLCETSYLHYKAQFCAPIQWKIGSFVKKSYARIMDFKIRRLPRKSGGLAALTVTHSVDIWQFSFVRSSWMP